MTKKLSTLLGQAVRLRRHDLGMSQEELAGRAGLNRTCVTDVEGGNRNLSLSTLENLAKAPGLKVFLGLNVASYISTKPSVEPLSGQIYAD